MNIQVERANVLKDLHIKGDPLILFNIWDAGSAKAVQASGAKVIATRSWAVATADAMLIPLFINARSDIFFKINPANHNDSHLEEAIRRADAYAKAGASGFFVPGLRDSTIIQKLCERSPIPINIMVMSDTPTPKQLVAIGVARISYGPGPYRQIMDSLQGAGRKALLLDS